ncbi:MAG TPA: hypothetical protein DDW94_11835 [Deltaproteobacteria bacterium]|nr:MAG: hypothetical protein A3I81_08265 [Deltaproteobacteria bacterium RIFCSPLOWO2_02_FULL_55_12]OIJ72748.1 MAG: hypothetical protein A2V21_312970 [Deltaproteobacteria bacterium GWC2_55_46]HBG47660.1 hypothetical protein [Deltaproteobacteria bacterium]HCY10571.1 hypothetical protein [Deltaproteobacteria bacterium]
MLRDVYYIRSLVSTCLFLGAVLFSLLFFLYFTGVYGAAAFLGLVFFLLAYFYRLHLFLFAGRRGIANGAIKEEPFKDSRAKFEV